MAGRKAFLLRVDPDLLEALQRWADEELRSLNGQIEFLLRRALSERRRVSRQAGVSPEGRAVDTGSE